METMTNDRQQVGFGMPVSGRVWMSTATTLSPAVSVAAAGSKRVCVEGTAVFVRDAPSVSGTFIAAPGAQDWVRVGTDPTQIFPDWSLRIGTRVFVFKGG